MIEFVLGLGSRRVEGRESILERGAEDTESIVCRSVLVVEVVEAAAGAAGLAVE